MDFWSRVERDFAEQAARTVIETAAHIEASIATGSELMIAQPSRVLSIIKYSPELMSARDIEQWCNRRLVTATEPFARSVLCLRRASADPRFALAWDTWRGAAVLQAAE